MGRLLLFRIGYRSFGRLRKPQPPIQTTVFQIFFHDRVSRDQAHYAPRKTIGGRATCWPRLSQTNQGSTGAAPAIFNLAV